jgi:hypothetical protein
VKDFARVCSSARTDQSQSVGNNSDKAAATSYRAAGFAGENSCEVGVILTSRIQEMQAAIFDCENPGRSGNLAGESYASVLENHERYPDLRSRRDAELLARLDRTVEQNIKRFTALLLPPLGFDEAGISQNRSAAIGAFRAALLQIENRR